MSCFTVYMHVSPNGKRYIGITSKKPEYRWNNGRGYIKNQYFFDAIVKYGWENFQHIIIADGLSKDDACGLEKALIAGCKTTDPNYGYNMSKGGESGTYGAKLSDEFREKARKRMLGPLNPNYGKKFSADTLGKLSAARKGKLTPGRLDALKKLHEHNKRKVICIDTGIVYESISDASHATNTPIRGIRSVCDGEYKRSHGRQWAYYDPGKRRKGK